jgi:hypothetical protein
MPTLFLKELNSRNTLRRRVLMLFGKRILGWFEKRRCLWLHLQRLPTELKSGQGSLMFGLETLLASRQCSQRLTI